MYTTKQIKAQRDEKKQSSDVPEPKSDCQSDAVQCKLSMNKVLQREEGLSDGISPTIPNITGMPNGLKSGLEKLSGYDLSSVRVHYNSPKPQQLGALAYAQGTNIHLGAGQEKHLPHEGWHVVQQMQGRVRPTMQMKGASINDDSRLEREADVMGARSDRFSNLRSNTPMNIKPINTSNIESSDIQRRSEEPSILREGLEPMRPVIQRDIGFEYETNADTYLAAAPITLAERQTNAMPVGSAALVKGDVLIANMNGLHAKADEGGIIGSNLEMETDHFPETAAGRAGLHLALKNLERFCRLIDAKSANQPHFASGHLAAAFGGAAPVANRYIRKTGGAISGNPQATVGVLLARIEQLMELIVGGPSVGPNAIMGVGAAPPLTRLELGAHGAPADFIAVGNAPGLVRAGINAYVLAHGGGLPVGFPSDRLIGLCSLMYSYINIGSGLAKTYAKQIAPLMARTDFGSMFGADIPVGENGFLSAGGGAEFVNMWTQIIAAGVGGGLGGPLIVNEPIVTAGLGLNISGNLTRLGWITNISQGVDQLTTANFPSAPEQPHLFGLGGLGGTHDAGTGPGVNAPIFELRRMMQGMAPHRFTEVAMGVFDYIVGLNNTAAGVVAPAYANVARPVKNVKLGQKFSYWWAGGR
jgi:hypothetical protein